MLAVEVFRLSQNAVRESSEVISEPKWAQSTLARIATSGSSTNAAPTRAGAYTHRGRSTGRGAVTGRLCHGSSHGLGHGFAKPASSRMDRPVSLVTRSMKSCARSEFFESLRATIG